MRALLIVIAGLALASFLQAQDKPGTPTLDPLPQLLATTRAFAEDHKLVVSGISGSRPGATQIGDVSTLLITLQDKKRLDQYLVTLEVVALNEQERANKGADANVYMSTGSHFVYHYMPVALQITTYGPFNAEAAGDSLQAPSTARVIVNGEHLALGFDNTCRACVRIAEYKRVHNDKTRFNVNFQPTPFPADIVEKTREAADDLKLTDVEERSFGGTMPAITSFFYLAENTPGLREILRDVVDFPSAWSIIKRGGKVEPRIGFEGSGVFDAGHEGNRSERFYLPLTLTLNEQKCLDVGIVVTAPQPPLLTTAGIERIYARSPSKHERMAYLEVIGTKLAPTTEAIAEKR